jgi:hypothetical protein
MARAFDSEEPIEDDLETLPRGEAEAAVVHGFASPTLAIDAAIKISNAHDRARRRFLRALARYNSWIARLLRGLGLDLPHLRRRLVRARSRYIAAQESLERARQDILIARNAARLIEARRHEAEVAQADAQSLDELVTWAVDHRRPRVTEIATTLPLSRQTTIELGGDTSVTSRHRL